MEICRLSIVYSFTFIFYFRFHSIDYFRQPSFDKYTYLFLLPRAMGCADTLAGVFRQKFKVPSFNCFGFLL